MVHTCEINLVPRVLSGKERGPWERGCCVVSSKWFEPRSISSSYCVIVRVSVLLKRTVVGLPDWRFDNLSGSHLQSQVNSVCQSMMFFKSGPLKTIGQLSHDGIG